MSVLIETNVGDLVVDLDIQGSPHLSRNFLKLAKVRYYTQTLIYNVQQGRFCQCGDQRGDGSGGCSIFGLLDAHLSGLGDVTFSHKRYIRSTGRLLKATELREKGRVVASEMLGMRDTIGSQFLITLDSGPGRALDGLGKITDLETEASVSSFLSLGKVVEDDNDVLGKINEAYCDRDGRPYADIRIVRMFILDDPFEDPDGLDQLMISYGVQLLKEDDLEESDRVCARWLSSQSPTFDRPPGERIEARIRADEIDLNDEGGTAGDRVNRIREKEARSQAVILEMVGDLPSADIKPPENVLFVCKLNPVTEDEDLELIFSRFDPNARAEIIRDPETGQSLQYAFIEFTTPEQCNEAYFKMNNTLIDDRRIKVDFSQSVAKIWNKYSQKRRGAFDERPNIQTDRNRGFHRPNHSDNVVDNQIIAQNGPISLRRNFNHHAGAAGDRRTSKHDYRHSSHHFHENDVDEKVRDIRNHRDDHGHKSHHHKSEERRRERIRSRSHDRGSDSDQSNDSSSHRHRKSHRKHKRKHKSHRKS